MAGTESTQTEKVTCSRCRRPLHSAASRALGIGPRCAAIEAATEGLSPAQVEKMHQAIEDKAIIPANVTEIWNVVNQAGEVIHTLHLGGNCSCEWGLDRNEGDKVCYHVAGARLLARPVIRTRRSAAAPVIVTLPAPAKPVDDFIAEMERLTEAFMAMA